MFKSLVQSVENFKLPSDLFKAEVKIVFYTLRVNFWEFDMGK